MNNLTEDRLMFCLWLGSTVIMVSILIFLTIGLFFPHITSAFDITPTVDNNPHSRALLVGPPTIYKFGQPQMKNITYSDGSVIPSVTMSIERYNSTTQHWEVIGYTNTHLHKLRVDATDQIDISLGHTDRINVKTKVNSG